MNYTTEAIKKAIEGGYNHPLVSKNLSLSRRKAEGEDVKPNFSTFFLDPDFWIALGKSLGWDEPEKEYELPRNLKERQKILIYLEDKVGVIVNVKNGIALVAPYSKNVRDYKETWHNFIDCLAEKKSSEEFFKQILTQNNE